METISKQVRKHVARTVQSICRAKNISSQALADDVKCDVRTIRNFFNGKSVKESTIRQICSELEIDFDQLTLAASSTTRSTDTAHGSYSEALVRNYIGHYYAFRRSYTDPGKLFRSVFKFEWSAVTNSLQFNEFQTYDSSRLKRRVNNDQSGDVFMSDTIGLVHLLTIHVGALRLITLTRLHHDENVMRGVVLTQAQWPDHYQPAVSPIYFEKLPTAAKQDDLLRQVGPIEADNSQEYLRIKTILDQVATDVALFVD